MGLWRRLFGVRAPTRPRSGNGSSSFHVWFEDLGSTDAVAVSATIEVLAEPGVDDLYFWALQATFTDASGSDFGAAHLGLQWNPRHPAHRAVNWGGYGRVDDVRSVLTGTNSELPSLPFDPNTRDYPWQAGLPYRLRISRGERGWSGEITDPLGRRQKVRELFAGGDRLRGFVMWSEVFAPCEAPPASVRWSEPTVEFADGSTRRPRRVKLSFPEGCCPNTDTWTDETGVVQMTGTRRRASAGQRLPVPPLT